MPAVNNKQIYSTVEFDAWAYGENLLDEEKYLIETYLNKESKILEAGTGGGRILLEMKKMGFKSLHGYDYMPEYIEQAKQRDPESSICFTVQDATQLKYSDSSFDQIVYLQQIVSLIENKIERSKAIQEAYRVLKKQGIALFSFLCLDSRRQSIQYLSFLMYLHITRKIRGSHCSLHYLPWLKLGGKPNWNALCDRQPYTYWYSLHEAVQALNKVGFTILAIGSTYQIQQRQMYASPESLVDEPIKGMLYCVCQKT
ncbi:class I SAM-dependent methyltransferase [Chroogloeocystis siderophila]|jgi:ubiquinone/menaquinone biosynthesis C-methylase UbiE|uniref:Methyltransferase type 11 n=1 Tax=Chroogloeocystis siderophila 5.2 s.c.1 TaxID=247279 RepID=A0A1U7HNF7_9CHRO|nr:class I SAM-dependent methyltransferase [Chroogloeocystis siderophila]OKH25078.1 methyltransferase type 11 [Chroogloeocystis siderophila 5.2 s.c.1]